MDNIEYVILEEYYPPELARQVKKKLADGWVLYGFPYADGKGKHLQCMLYIEKKKPTSP